MTIEACLSLWAAIRARSPALLAFGGDSAIELFSALVVLQRFRRDIQDVNAERRAARMAGILLLCLAVFVATTSVLSLRGYSEPTISYAGMVILLAASAIMPWLAHRKRRLSEEAGSAALLADAAESAVCGYLSIVALLGLAARALFGIEWADPVSALLCIPILGWEGRKALRGEHCECP